MGAHIIKVGLSPILIDPMFENETGGDFDLVGGSPAIDTAVDVNVDVNGLLAGDYNGGAPDRGGREAR